MMKRARSKVRSVLFVVVGSLMVSACAGQMALSAKMSDTVFLDPDTLDKNKRVFVRVTNTSDFQEINFADLLKSKLAAKGCAITNSTSDAGFIIQANLLYLGKESKDLSAKGALAGGFSGAALGATTAAESSSLQHIGSNTTKGGLAGAAAGAVVGGVLGALVRKDTYFGACDVQIKEASDSPVEGVIETNAKQGSSTVVRTKQEVKSNRQEYRTRIVVDAQQVNSDRAVVCGAIADRLATQIAGMF